MTVADVLADGLSRAGTRLAFAATGDETGPPLLQAFARAGLGLVRVARADLALVMAAAWGRAADAPGAAVVTTDGDDVAAGLAYAFAARAPLIVVTDRAASAPEATLKATLDATPESAAHWIAHACQLALKEPRGPVRLDVRPGVADAPALPLATSCRPAPLPPPAADALAAAASALDRAERPVVVVGRFCRAEADARWVRAFAESKPAPILPTPGARGAVPDPHPLVIGTLDGGDPERQLLSSADLVVAIGVDSLEAPRGVSPSSTPEVWLTPVAPEIEARPCVAVVGDVGLILEELAPRVRDGRLAEWDVARLHAWKQAAAMPPRAPRHLVAYRIVEAARQLAPAGTIAVFEGGETWWAAARAWQAVGPGECVLSTDTATDGFALAVAAATQLARPEGRVVCFTEVPALEAAADQLQILARLGLPVVIVALADTACSPLHAANRVTARLPEEFARTFASAWEGRAPTVVAVAPASG